MPARTYLPTLYLIARGVRLYCTRYDSTIRKNMSSEVQVIYDALLDALDSLLAAIDVEKGA